MGASATTTQGRIILQSVTETLPHLLPSPGLTRVRWCKGGSSSFSSDFRGGGSKGSYFYSILRAAGPLSKTDVL